MMYKNFDETITRRHGIVIKGWPMPTFNNPSTIGSQMELGMLLNSWQSGMAYFHKMNAEEHMAWIEAHAGLVLPSIISAEPPATSSLLLPVQDNGPDSTLAANPSLHTSFIHFETPTAPSVVTNLPAGGLKKPRKTQSDKGKPRKKAPHIQGTNVFSANMS